MNGLPMAQKYRRPALTQVKKALAAFILAVFVLTNLSGPVFGATAAAGRESAPKVIMFIINRVTLDDLTNSRYRNIQRLITMGGLGLMTINTSGDFTDMNAYVSIGAGDKMIGSALAGESYNRDEVLKDGFTAAQAYQRNTGHNPGASQVLNVSIANSQIANSNKYTLAAPGELGDIIHKAGLETAVIGNSDLAPNDPPNRLAPAIVMDRWGKVDQGNVSQGVLVKDSGFPYGWRTDYHKVKTELDRIIAKADLIVIESGDTARANAASSTQLKKMVEYHRDQALKKADSFVGELLPLVNRSTMVMVVAPLPHAQALRDGNRLSPLVIAGGNIEPGSVLTSPTTRQPGLVANYDIAATVVEHLKIKSGGEMLGIPIGSVPETGPQESVGKLGKWLTANSIQRVGVLFYFIRYQWIIYSVLFLMLVIGFFRKPEAVRFFLTGLLLYPLVILLLPLTGSLNPWVTIAESLLLLVMMTFLFTRIKNDWKLFTAVALANILPAVADVLAGGYLMKRAALSYDLVVGGRFYGIGNEYMGIVIGAAVLGTAALLQMYPEARKILLILYGAVFAGLIFFFAAPTIGSKAGGAITATVAFSAAYYGYIRRKINLKSILIFLGALIAGVAILAVFNYLFPVGEQSHIGRAFANLFRGNFDSIWQMILRKVRANYYLLQHSPFSIILLLQALLWGVIYCRWKIRLAALNEELPYFSAGMTAMFYGALATVLLNDSGAIGAPLLLNYLVVPLVIQIWKPGYKTGEMK